jgi:hypothetical protein
MCSDDARKDGYAQRCCNEGRRCYLSGGHAVGVTTIGHARRYYRWEAVLQGEGAMLQGQMVVLPTKVDMLPARSLTGLSLCVEMMVRSCGCRCVVCVRILLTFLCCAGKRRVHVGGGPGGTHVAQGRWGIGGNSPPGDAHRSPFFYTHT